MVDPVVASERSSERPLRADHISQAHGWVGDKRSGSHESRS